MNHPLAFIKKQLLHLKTKEIKMKRVVYLLICLSFFNFLSGSQKNPSPTEPQSIAKKAKLTAEEQLKNEKINILHKDDLTQLIIFGITPEDTFWVHIDDSFQAFPALILAVKYNASNIVTYFLTRQPDCINTIVDQNKNSSLHSAVSNPTMLKLLLDHVSATTAQIPQKLLINRQNNDDDTALMLASSKNKPESVQLLLDQQADPNIKNNKGSTALILAAYAGHDNIVNKLLNHGADPNIQNNTLKTALTVAVFKKHIRSVQLLLDHQSTNLNLQNDNQLTALMVAVQANNIDMVQSLLNKKADPNIQDIKKMSALMMATIKGYVEIVNSLLKHGCDLDLQDAKGKTALMFAAQNESVQIVQSLLENKADPNIQNHNGDTALIFATEKNNAKIVELLLQQETINPNLHNTYGISALMFSAFQANTSIFNTIQASLTKHPLPENIVHVHLQNMLIAMSLVEQINSFSLFLNEFLRLNELVTTKNTKIYYSLTHNNSNLKKIQNLKGNQQYLAIQAMINSSHLNLHDNIEETALHRATNNNLNPDFVKELIFQGADPNLPDSNGNNCLILSILNNFKTLAAYFIDKTTNLLHKNNDGDDAFTLALEIQDLRLFNALFKAINLKLAPEQLHNFTQDLTQRISDSTTISKSIKNDAIKLMTPKSTDEPSSPSQKTPKTQSKKEQPSLNPSIPTKKQPKGSVQEDVSVLSKIEELQELTQPAKATKPGLINRITDLVTPIINENFQSPITDKIQTTFGTLQKWHNLENVSVDLNHIFNICPFVKQLADGSIKIDFTGGHSYQAIENLITKGLVQERKPHTTAPNGCIKWLLKNNITGAQFYKTTFPKNSSVRDILTLLLQSTVKETFQEIDKDNKKQTIYSLESPDKTMRLNCIVQKADATNPNKITTFYPVL